MTVKIFSGENMEFLRSVPDCSFDLIYIDPPFNTGVKRRHGDVSFDDSFEDYVGFIGPRLRESRRILKDDGSLFIHLDPRESHYVKVFLDGLFGRESFMNEVVWAYDYGGRSRKKWSSKHDVILWYVVDPRSYCFNFDSTDRIPYMAPGLVGKERASRGKVPTDVWWHTIVPTNGRERLGYPTQKPRGILDRIVRVHSDSGDELLDFFAGSGTLGESGASMERNVTLVDDNPDAIEVMKKRLSRFDPIVSLIDKKYYIEGDT